jgi:hypothetical protein
MTENFIFKALFISLAAHTAVLCVTYWSKISDPHYKAIRQNQIEISYKPAHRRAADIREHPIKPAQRLDFSNNQKLFSDGAIPVSLVKERPMLPFGMFYERKPEYIRTMELSRKVSTMRIISSEKINNPVYTAYCQMIHSRMSRFINKNYDTPEVGTVYLTFLLNDKGALVDMQVVPEKTNASEHLKEIAMQSLKEASPFPNFYKGMLLPEYSFNIEIDYKVDD